VAALKRPVAYRWGSAGTLVRAGVVLAREGALASIDPTPFPRSARTLLRLGRLLERRDLGTGSGERLAAAIDRLGPSYVKLGQFLATRPDVVGAIVADDLGRLQDRMAPFPQGEAVRRVEEALGRPIGEIFAEFGPAVGAASIAQVHKAAIIEDGVRREVAVKILRPGIERRFRQDLRAFYGAAAIAERMLPASRRLKPLVVVDLLANWVSVEMDLRLEAAALSEMAENTADDPGFRVPAVHWERTARTVLTLDWIDGIKLNDRAALEAAGLDLPALGRHLIQTFLRHALRDGFFHADMHPGNLFVDAAGDIVAVDFGIMGRLGRKERRFLAEILYGFITRDYRRTAEVHFEAGYVPPEQSVDEFARALRAIGEPIHSRTADQISMARLLTQLFEVTELFSMQTRPELLLLQKTMVVVEGVARTLDPKLDMWRTADPVVRGWIERHLGPVGILEEIARGGRELARGLAGAPDMLVRGEAVVARLEKVLERGVPVSSDSLGFFAEAAARHSFWRTAAIWVGAAALVAIAFSVG
jgi:ubiquinone biosynthesis protein